MKQKIDKHEQEFQEDFLKYAYRTTDFAHEEVEKYEAIADKEGLSKQFWQEKERRVRKRTVATAGKRLGAVAAVFLVVFGITLALPAVGFEWRDVFECNGWFSFAPQEFCWGDYRLGYVPEGFVRGESDSELILERNPEIISFWYSDTDIQGKLSGDEITEVDINGRSGILQTYHIEGETWYTLGYYFGSDFLLLRGNASTEELLKIARNIEKIK